MNTIKSIKNFGGIMKKIITFFITILAIGGFKVEAYSDGGILTRYKEYVNSININKEINFNLYRSNDKFFKEEYKTFTKEENNKEGFHSLNSLIYLEKKTDKPYEVIESYSEGYRYLDKANSREEAINKANKFEDVDIIEKGSITAVIDHKGEIIYSPLALGRIIKHEKGVPYKAANINTNIYEDEELTKIHSYINHQYIDDVAIIEDKGDRAKIQISGYKGWINKDSESLNYEMIVLPINKVKSPSYYKNENGRLIHFVSKDIINEKEIGSKLDNGKAPNFLEENKKYYSYDGVYFYESLENLLIDLKEDSNLKAINKEPFKAEYLNLSFDSNSNLKAAEINSFFNKNTKENSKLRWTGGSFIAAEKRYGVNALTMVAIAANESSWGCSEIAVEKNNLFGINARDSAPGIAAGTFNSVDHCIEVFAKEYIDEGYGNPEDWRYRGDYLGNKDAGANVKYSSDPYWGEKTASVMYRIESEVKSRE